MRSSWFVLMAAAIASQVPADPAVATEAPTVTRNLDLPVPASPRVSPDGREVVYLQSRTDWETMCSRTIFGRFRRNPHRYLAD